MLYLLNDSQNLELNLASGLLSIEAFILVVLDCVSSLDREAHNRSIEKGYRE
jgi:hypothetical protein